MIAQSRRDGCTGPNLLGQEKPFRVLKEVSGTGAELRLESRARGRPEPLRAKNDQARSNPAGARREVRLRIAVGALSYPGLTTGSSGGYDTGARGPADADPGPTVSPTSWRYWRPSPPTLASMPRRPLPVKASQNHDDTSRPIRPDRPDRRGPRQVPRTEAPLVTEAVGPFEGVEAARQPGVSRTVSCSFSCSQRDSKQRQGRHPGPSPASMAHTRESYGYICTL